MAVYSSAWFWILIIAIIFIIMAFIGFWLNRNNTTSPPTPVTPVTPTWVWVLFVLGILFIFFAIGLYAYSSETTTSSAVVVSQNPTVVTPQNPTVMVQQTPAGPSATLQSPGAIYYVPCSPNGQPIMQPIAQHSLLPTTTTTAVKVQDMPSLFPESAMPK